MSNTPVPTLLWLEDAAAQAAALVGGKVAHLSRLAARYRVPPGFCLTTEAFRLWAPGGYESTLARQTVPGELHDTLAAAYAELAERTHAAVPRIAVRSSAVGEDSGGASFAGQYETYLNIVGVEAASQAVLRCWEMVRSTRVLAYRRQQGLTLEGPGMAVLLQQLVTADVAAIVFSANPVTGNRQEIVVNASWGLGASIADGTVTPDTYRLARPSLDVCERQVADKERMTVMVPGGIKEVPVPRFLRTTPAVDDAQLQAMGQLALRLEEDLGWPVDIECAWQAGQLYLLQCRPITTLR